MTCFQGMFPQALGMSVPREAHGQVGLCVLGGVGAALPLRPAWVYENRLPWFGVLLFSRGREDSV